MIKPRVIAEIGINHNGNIDRAMAMVKEAHRCGADVVKFQKRDVDTCYTQEELQAPCKSPWGKTVEAKVRGRELSWSFFYRLTGLCEDLDIGWSCSAFDLSTLKRLEREHGEDIDFHKVPSCMARHGTFLKEVASYKRLTLVSVGLAKDLDEVMRVASVFEAAACPYVLNVTTAVYPTPVNRVNLNRIETLQALKSHGLSDLCVGVGYSGHEVGVLPSVIAAHMGSIFVERHFTMDRSWYGADQAASLEPHGLELLCRDIKMLGSLGGAKDIALWGDEKNPVPNLR